MVCMLDITAIYQKVVNCLCGFINWEPCGIGRTMKNVEEAHQKGNIKRTLERTYKEVMVRDEMIYVA